MKSRTNLLLIFLLNVAAAVGLLSPAAAQNIVEQRIVIGFGFWNDDNYTIHAHINLGASSLPDGGYYIHFTEHNGATSFDAPFEIIKGEPSPAVFDWAPFQYQARFVPDGGTTIAAVSVFGPGGTAPASGEITVWRRDVYYPDGNVPEEVGHDFNFNVLVGVGPTPTPAPPPVKCNDDKSGGNQADCQGCSGDPGPAMAQYSVHSLLASLNIKDTPLRYTPPIGPAVNFTVTYNQNETQQPVVFSYSNLGPKWTFGWLSYVTDNPNTQLPSISVYVPGGGEEVYPFDSISQTFLPDPQSHTLLVRTGSDSYEKIFPDGSKQVFAHSNNSATYPRKIFMTQMIDPAGNSVSIEYDSSLRVTKITDALDQETLVYYELELDPLKITKVADPFGVRFATFEYEDGMLKTITDEIGIQSVFGYQSGTDLIESLTTPYGTTTFERGGSGTNRWIEITDPSPLSGKERVEYRDNAPGIAATDPSNWVPTGFTSANAGLDTANTFYWDRKAMAEAPGDYTKATIKHWLLNTDGSVSGILHSEKKALERRVWYAYLDQPDYHHVGPSANPSMVARVLGDGTTQLFQYEYNSLGSTIKATDPAGRVMSYIYDSNEIDLLEIRQTTGTNDELVRKFEDYYLHKPRTDIDTAGQATYFTFNTAGQITSRTNPKGEQTTYAYGDGSPAPEGSPIPVGYLASITSPAINSASAVTRFQYDAFNRVRTVINDPDDYRVTTDYDHLDRKTTVTYPDATFEEFRYEQDFGQGVTTILDLTSSRDRLGKWTNRHYNVNRQMDSITDPENRTTLYGWCACGSLETITDPNENVTTFNRDLQSRVYQKVFMDTTTINYLFEGQTAPDTVGATSRLQSATDALGRRTNYLYLADDNISGVSYTNTSGGQLSPPTPAVTFTYDLNYNRVETMMDGIGLTTYEYYPFDAGVGAGKLQSIDGPLADDIISFAYDELGRMVEQSIANVTETVTYDALGRLATTDNALGLFERSYDGVTPRLLTLTYPNGQTANYTYFGNDHDRRLQTAQNLDPGSANLSQFDYTYNAEGPILSWGQQLGTVSSGRWFEYDDARQLVSARNDSSVESATLVMGYGYDAASSRNVDSNFNPQTETGTFRSYTLNTLNQIESFSVSQGMLTWEAFLSHDSVGNLTDDGQGKTFEWDAANRLRAINYGSQRSEFTYDGLSRRVQIVEKTGSTVTSTKQFVWVGNTIAQERDASNVIKRSYFAEGEERGLPGVTGTKQYYYSRDHLGSVREVTKKTGALEAQYDYDPYGQRTKISGSFDADFGYTGHYHHAPSGLNLTLYRAYNSELGRWISRDPLKDAEINQGANLYAYIQNSPTNAIDPDGLATKTFIKTDGKTDWSGYWSHLKGHFDHPRTGFGASGNKAVQIVFRNVCSDPVYKHLKSVKSSNGWGAHKDPPNGAHIDVSTTAATGYYALNRALIPWGPDWKDPARDVHLIAECEDGCSP